MVLQLFTHRHVATALDQSLSYGSDTTFIWSVNISRHLDGVKMAARAMATLGPLVGTLSLDYHGI